MEQKSIRVLIAENHRDLSEVMSQLIDTEPDMRCVGQVTDASEVLPKAREAAADKDVFVGGGASVINQYLAAGLVDEVELQVVPLVLGSGARLLEGVGPEIKLEQLWAMDAPGVTHLKYRVLS